MTKKLVLAAITWLSLGSPVSSAEPDEKLHERCLYPTVKINDSSMRSGGSGFIVRSEKVGSRWNNVVVSCAHNFTYGQKYFVSVGEYKGSEMNQYLIHPCEVVAKEPKYDTAVVVFTSDKKMPTAEFGFDEKLHIGTKVWKFGYGMMDACRLDRGEVTWLSTSFGDRGWTRTNAFTIPGDSGGPLFCDYKVVGIMNQIRSAGGMWLPQMSYAVPIGMLKKWDGDRKSSLSWVYTPKPMPVLPFMRLELDREMAAAEEATIPPPMEIK